MAVKLSLSSKAGLCPNAQGCNFSIIVKILSFKIKKGGYLPPFFYSPVVAVSDPTDSSLITNATAFTKIEYAKVCQTFK